MEKLSFFLAVLIITSPVVANAEEVIQKGEVLTLTRCIEISLQRHPTISAQKGVVLANKSRVGEAQSNYYPQISASAGYSRVHPTSNQSGITSTGSGGFSTGTGAFDQYTGGVSLNQNIYDFGRTSTQVNISKLNLDSSMSDLENVTEQLIFNIKQAYFGVLQAQRNSAVAEETVKQFQQHLDQAKAFYEVGTHPKFDVTKAEVDLSNAKLNLIKAENAVKLSKVTLNNAMGEPDAPEYSIEDNLSFQKYPVTLKEAIDQAYKNRPDLKSVLSRKVASEKSIELAKAGYYPFLTGNAAYNRAGSSFPLGEGWNVGFAVSVPIFNGFLTKKQIEEARANLDTARANEDSLKQSILLEVQQAYLNLLVAGDSIANTELTVKQATENFEIANGRYAAGVGNPIEVTDADVILSNAKTAFNQALYDYKIARASLEKAMGLR